MQRPPSIVVGESTQLSVMADWNPAEMIGTVPGRLAASLYRYVITDEAWAVQRAEAGYRDVWPRNLLVELIGHPYVDLRVDFNSFVPAELPEALAKRLVDHYLDNLARRPELHDKVEFDVVLTCLSFDFDRQAERLRDAGFAKHEIEQLRVSLRTITANTIHRCERDVAAIPRLEARSGHIVESVSPPLERAYRLLEEARGFGAPLFAHLARQGFVAAALLSSLRAVGHLSDDEVESFRASVQTVSRSLLKHAAEVARGARDWNSFVEAYGHLRPGSYDITSDCYAAAPEKYLRPIVEGASERPVADAEPVSWSDTSRKATEVALSKLDLGMEPQGLGFLNRPWNSEMDMGRGQVSPEWPRVWVLADYMVGHTHQCVGLAEALGWSYEVKALEFNRLNGLNNQILGATRLTLTRDSATKLGPPWPDLLICAGRRLTPPARFVARHSGGLTRIVQLGRKGGNVAEPFDLVVSCAHFGQPAHRRRLEVLAPVNRVTDELLAREASDWQQLCPDPEHAPIGVLVGGSCGSHRLDAEIAGTLGQEVRDFARHAGRSVVAVTSRRTSSAAIQALEPALGDSCSLFYRWRPADSANPYWGCLALASALVVTGESESMLGEAAAAGKPVYIYPWPERRRLHHRISGWMVASGRSAPRTKLFSRLAERGLVHVPRDLTSLHRGLITAGVARQFGEPFDETACAPLREMSKVVNRIHRLMQA